jgi:hypothetical protein
MPTKKFDKLAEAVESTRSPRWYPELDFFEQDDEEQPYIPRYQPTTFSQLYNTPPQPPSVGGGYPTNALRYNPNIITPTVRPPPMIQSFRPVPIYQTNPSQVSSLSRIDQAVLRSYQTINQNQNNTINRRNSSILPIYQQQHQAGRGPQRSRYQPEPPRPNNYQNPIPFNTYMLFGNEGDMSSGGGLPYASF